MALYRVKAGRHDHKEGDGSVVTYEKGDVFREDTLDLPAMFPNKFEIVPEEAGKNRIKIAKGANRRSPAPKSEEIIDSQVAVVPSGGKATRMGAVKKGKLNEKEQHALKNKPHLRPDEDDDEDAPTELEADDNVEVAETSGEMADVTEDYPKALEADLKVFQDEGGGLFVADKDDPTAYLNDKPLKDAKDISKFIKGHKGG